MQLLWTFAKHAAQAAQWVNIVGPCARLHHTVQVIKPFSLSQASGQACIQNIVIALSIPLLV